jgi:hypothetical protein
LCHDDESESDDLGDDDGDGDDIQLFLSFCGGDIKTNARDNIAFFFVTHSLLLL